MSSRPPGLAGGRAALLSTNSLWLASASGRPINHHASLSPPRGVRHEIPISQYPNIRHPGARAFRGQPLGPRPPCLFSRPGPFRLMSAGLGSALSCVPTTPQSCCSEALLSFRTTHPPLSPLLALLVQPADSLAWAASEPPNHGRTGRTQCSAGAPRTSTACSWRRWQRMACLVGLLRAGGGGAGGGAGGGGERGHTARQSL